MLNPENPRRLAIWSGPRNLSTALMRSFSSRPDTAVSDEPFYAAYLRRTGYDHPSCEEILASQPDDWKEVAHNLSEGSAPFPCALWMQKQMSKHMLPEMLGDWLLKMDHVFLLRDPRRVITSYLKVIPEMSISDTGLPWQTTLMNFIQEKTDHTPPVIRAEDLRLSPEATLRSLCAALNLEWNDAMLSWPPGPHPQDGVWGSHWYANTWSTTGFDPDVTPEDEAPTPDVPFFEEAMEMHAQLEAFTIKNIF
jgi:hypothetical protein